MQKPGCQYRNGNCVFNRFYGNVDPECTMGAGGCQLKGNDNTLPPVTTKKRTKSDMDFSVGNVGIKKFKAPKSTAASIPIQEIPEEMRRTLQYMSLFKEPTGDPSKFLEHHKGKYFVSGPVGIAVFKNNETGDVYYLLSDAHYSLIGSCPIEDCMDHNVNGNDIGNPNSNCSFIRRLLKDIFEVANQNGIGVDFYLEYPYALTNDAWSQVDIQAQNNFIFRIAQIFKDCFTKRKGRCDYGNVRFHYLDIRQILAQPNQQSNIWSSFGKFLFLNLVRRETTAFVKKVAPYGPFGDIKKLDRPIDNMEMLNTVINKMYKNNGEVAKKIFRLYLESDDFVRDLMTVLMQNFERNFLQSEDMKAHLSAAFSLLTERDNKIMHRIRAQLYELEKEGKRQLADMIKQTALVEFEKNIDPKDTLDFWYKIYSAYKSFIRVRQTGIQSFGKLKEQDAQRLNTVLELVKDLDNPNANIVKSHALLADAYLLGRLFREYTQPRHGRQPGFKSKIKMIYAGDAHIEKYYDFLDAIGYSKVYEYSNMKNISDYSRCVVVPYKTPADYLNL